MLTRNGCKGAVVGEDYWELYEGGSDGFADSLAQWALPVLGFGQSSDEPVFELTADGFTADCASGRTVRYLTMDLSGDGLVDMVLTRNGCEGSTVGTDLWQVYESDGSGFSSESRDLELPAVGFGQSSEEPVFELTADGFTADCASGRTVRYSLLDLDGNGVPELTLTRNGCEGAAVGTDYWTTWLGECR